MHSAVSSVLSLQIGPKANFLGSYLWQIRDQDSSLRASVARQQKYYMVDATHSEDSDAFPKNVVVDFDFAPQQSSPQLQQSDNGQGGVDGQETWRGQSTVVRRGNQTSRQSTFISKIRNKPSHPKTEIRAPKPQHKSWYSGTLSSTAMTDLQEETLESLRHFAESCDRVEAIDCVIDLDADLGLLAERLLDEIRIDYGASVSLPLWVVESAETRLSANLLAPEKSLVLQSLTNPLAIARFTEYADVVIALDPQSVLAAHTAYDVQVPFGIEGLLSFRTGSGTMLTTREFVDACTYRKTFPVCGFESACYRSDEHLPAIESFFESERDRHAAPLNPMMIRRSPVPQIVERNVGFTNFAVFRGWSDPDIPRKLYDEARRGNYFMSHCLLYPSPLFGHIIGAEDFERFEYSVAVASAIYADASIGAHIAELQHTWKENSERVKDQLAKMSIEGDDLVAVSEKLLEMSEKYTSV